MLLTLHSDLYSTSKRDNYVASITILGAANGVTGSCYLIETIDARILLECGLVRGSSKEELINAKPFPFAIDSIDAVVLSHGHLDHSGRLPRLIRDGYSASIVMTPATAELLDVLLKDAASLEKRDTEWENKRLRRAGRDEIEPLFTIDDVDATLKLCTGIDYGVRHTVASGIDVCFQDAGHILGSAIVELFVTENGVEKKLVFSGDLGNADSALMPAPATIAEADLVLMESTYGDREHRPMQETLDEFTDIIEQASNSGGNILIPAFAIGRAQEILFRLGELYQQGRLKTQAVYLDSPMAIAATEVYHRHQSTFRTHDREKMHQANATSLHSFLPVLRYTASTQESIALNRIESGVIIIAGSGMCNGGRIRHHLIQNLWKRSAHVVIIGYQAQGTPGRALVDGASYLRIGKQEIAVKAAIHTLGGFSAHAGRSQLLHWAKQFKQTGSSVQLIHGDAEAKTSLRDALISQGQDAQIPLHGESIEF